MLVTTVIMGVMAVILLTIGYARGEGQHVEGLMISANMIVKILPLLAFALIIAGMAQVLIPQESIARWVGGESGLKGILIGSLAGGLTPGGPFVCFPIVAGLYRAGASIGTTVAYATGWSLLSIARLPMEAGFLGMRFMLIRLACTAIFPILAGLLAQAFFSRVAP